MILDLIALAIILLYAIFGYKKGLIRSILGLASFFLAVVITMSMYTYAVDFLKRTGVEETIRKQITQSLGEDSIKTENMPKAIEDGINSTITSAKTSVADSLTNMVIKGICIFVFFFVVLFLLKLVIPLLDKVFSLPVLNEFNKVSGMLFGILSGLLILFILSSIMIFLVSNQDSWLSVQLANSKFMSIIYNNNPLYKLLTKTA